MLLNTIKSWKICGRGEKFSQCGIGRKFGDWARQGREKLAGIKLPWSQEPIEGIQ